MALAFDKEVGTATGTDVASTLGIPVAAGGVALNNVVVVRGACRGQTISTVTDSRGNTYTVKNAAAPNTNDGGIRPCIAFSKLSTALQAADTITVTFSGNGARSAAAASWSGNNISFDQQSDGVTNQAFGTAVTHGSVTTSVVALVILAAAIDTNQTAFATPPTGYTNNTGISNASSRGIVGAYKIQTVAGTETTPTGTMTSNTQSMGMTVTLIEASTWNKTVTAIAPADRMQIEYGTRWYMGAGSPSIPAAGSVYVDFPFVPVLG